MEEWKQVFQSCRFHSSSTLQRCDAEHVGTYLENVQNLFLQCVFGHRPDDLSGNFAIFEDEECRDTPNAVLHRGLAVVVNI